jgi:hypothetical protein
MCQQWVSIAGLVFDVVGFLIIAVEWRHVFEHSVALRQDAVQRDYELMAEGEEATRARREADASMWRNTQRENRKDNQLRRRMFYTGAALVVLGFVGQLIGSFPHGQSWFGFASCS